MSASATVSANRDTETHLVIEPLTDSRDAHGAAPGELSAWHPVTEQSILAALATLTART